MLPGDYRTHSDQGNRYSPFLDEPRHRPRRERMSPLTAAFVALVSLAAALAILVWLTAG